MSFNFWKNKRVLITGHTGFKGSWFCLWLQKLKANLCGYALCPPTEPSLFELTSVVENMTSIEADIRDFKKLKKCIKDFKPEIIFHMAAQSLVPQSYTSPVETYETNVMGTVNLLESIRGVEGVKILLNITTDKCYENREWFWGYRENEALGGKDPYSSSKACSELVTRAYRSSFFSPEEYKKHGVAIASARAGNVIGGGDWAEDRLIPDCIRSWSAGRNVIIRYPDAIRPWQHVLDALYGYMILAEKMYEDGAGYAEAWNFAPEDENAISVRDVISSLGKYWGNGADFEIESGCRPYEASYLKLDCSKAKMKLGWQGKWKLDLALKKIVQWYQVFLKEPKAVKAKTLEQIDEYMRCLNH